MWKNRGCCWKEYRWFTQSSAGSDCSFLFGTEGLLQNNNRLMHKHKSKSTTAWPINLQGGLSVQVFLLPAALLKSLTYIWAAAHAHEGKTKETEKCWPRQRCPLRGRKAEEQSDWGDVEEISSIKIYVRDIHITLL